MTKHYVIIRRDLPLGVCCAMILHAAAESKYDEVEYWKPDQSERHNIAVVLGVDSELELLRVYKSLTEAGVRIAGVTESGGPYDGQFMSIGVLECQATEAILGKLPILKDLYGTEFEPTEVVVEYPRLDNGWGV